MTAKTTEGDDTVGETETPFCPILDEEVGLKEFFRSTKRTSVVGVEVEETLEEMESKKCLKPRKGSGDSDKSGNEQRTPKSGDSSADNAGGQGSSSKSIPERKMSCDIAAGKSKLRLQALRNRQKVVFHSLDMPDEQVSLSASSSTSSPQSLCEDLLRMPTLENLNLTSSSSSSQRPSNSSIPPSPPTTPTTKRILHIIPQPDGGAVGFITTTADADQPPLARP